MVLTVVLVSTACAAAAALAVALVKARAETSAAVSRAEMVHEQSVGELSMLHDAVRHLSERLSSDASVLSNRLEGIDSRMLQTQTASTDLARNIFDSLGEIRQATSAVAEQAGQFTALQDLLKPPKARGGVGEAMLEELLRQVLPPTAYACQHRFTSGVVVDAMVRAGRKIVCIDSKFPLANFKRICDATNDRERKLAENAFASDVDRHITDIARRYVVPDEGTFDFAVMYVPAEGVYAEVLRLAHRGRPLWELAIDRHVVPMSPLTMYGYLQTVLYGLRCFHIEEDAQRILDFCGRLQQDMERFTSEYDVLGKHLSNARTKYEEGARKLNRFQNKLEQVVELNTEDDHKPALEVVGE
ncbi:MAG: DNA recombination protein RmuC [Actinomycetota bacterium]|nr:DNA recombination protein RmuC [Actinomycetota bacterium]